MKQTIYFRADADEGRYSGFGHLNRTLQIYSFLKRKFLNKYLFVFLIKKNSTAIKLLKKKFNEKILIYSKKNISKMKFYSKDIFIIDTLGVEKELVKQMNKFNIKKRISFDEINKNLLKIGIIINGIFFAKKKLLGSKHIKIYQGEKYIVINKSYKKKIYKKKDDIKKILVMSGGADYKNFLFKILNYLKDEKQFKIEVVIGPGVKKTNKIHRINSLRVKKSIGLNNLSKSIIASDICICTGGTTMFEVIASGKVPIVIENYDHQKYAIEYFNKKKAIIYGGKSTYLNKKNLFDLLDKQIYFNTKKCFYNNTNLVDGKGFERVNSIISNYIK